MDAALLELNCVVPAEWVRPSSSTRESHPGIFQGDMLAWVVRTPRTLTDVLLGALAVSAGALPYAHERLMRLGDGATAHGMNGMSAVGGMVAMSHVSVAAAHALITVKGLVALLVVASVMARRAGTQADGAHPRCPWRRLAVVPLRRTALLIAAAVALGLAAFDVCTGFHGAGMDASGACHCWTTGLFVSMAALVAGCAVLFGRNLAAFAKQAIAAIVRFVFRLWDRDAAANARSRSAPTRPTIRADACRRRRSAGRAPPRHPIAA